MIVAHVAGIPVEESLLPLAPGIGAGLLLVRVWVVSRVRRAQGARRSIRHRSASRS